MAGAAAQERRAARAARRHVGGEQAFLGGQARGGAVAFQRAGEPDAARVGFGKMGAGHAG